MTDEQVVKALEYCSKGETICLVSVKRIALLT